ncbi:MAG: hypothetical protein AB7E51_06785 [Pseudodesulfovibrio sp.]|uniref:hypothetical protein n=1 Tax=Pseudodesulfovibrio sp. TaxID=2035812 RepID=UPI003D1092B2
MSQKLFTQARQVVALAIVGSAEIAAFVAEEFPGKTIKVYREVLKENPPPAENCPFVAFGPFTHAQMDKDPHRIEHAMPMGVFVSKSNDYTEAGGVYVVESVEVLEELAALVEQVASAALLAAGYAFEQDPFLSDDDLWDEYSGSFYLYRVRTTRRINL